jgi:HK97 family phage prohead protease
MTPKRAPNVIQLEPLTLRAPVRSLDPEKRTAEVIISAAGRVLRRGWDGPFYEELSLEKKHVRLKRLNNGAPLLNAHGGIFGPMLEDVIGVVERAELEDGGPLVGSVRFARAADDAKADQVFRKVEDGIIRNVSVGYRIWKLEKVEEEEGKPPVFRATDWEPYEVSLVPMGADDGAKVRADGAVETNRCQIVGQMVKRKEMLMKNRTGAAADVEAADANRSDAIDEIDPPDPSDTVTDPPEPSERDAGATAERERVQGIRQACIAGRMTRDFEDKLIKDGMSLVQAQSRVFEEIRKRVDPNNAPDPAGARGAREILVGDDPHIHVRKGIENAILHRVAPDFFKLEEVGRKYRGMTLLDVARVMLNARGVRTTDCSKMEMAGLALGLISRGGMHTTSDFPILLADVARKTLRASYEEAEQTFKSIGRRTTLPDFKISNRMQLGDAPALLEVKEHGEYTRGTITEGKEQLRLLTYGRVFAITRQALVNDDTDAFSRVPTAFGRSARTLEADLVWKQITDNPVMGDGIALFHASHGNLDAVPSVISVASLGKGRAAMRVQKGLDGVTVLNIVPKYLGTPAALETTAATFLVQVTPATPANVNPFAGLLSPLTEPRLDAAAGGTTAWYLFADGTKVDIIEYAYLEGEEGPMVEERIGFDIDGLEVKCRLDFGAKVIDWRGLWKNPGV